MNVPDNEQLTQALKAASKAHHDYQTNALGGKHDQQWPGWYAAYVVGRLGEFTSPSILSRLLSEAPGGSDWNESAANFVLSKIRNI